MAGFLILPLRIAQALMGAAVLGHSAYVAHWYNADTLTASPSQFNFLIFASVFSIISILYLEVLPRRWPRGSHPYAHFALEILNTIFYFCGFIALSIFHARLLFCRGSVCLAARADVAFALFNFCLWLATTVILCVEIFKGGFRSVKANHAIRAEMAKTPGAAA